MRKYRFNKKRTANDVNLSVTDSDGMMTFTPSLPLMVVTTETPTEIEFGIFCWILEKFWRLFPSDSSLLPRHDGVDDEKVELPKRDAHYPVHRRSTAVASLDEFWAESTPCWLEIVVRFEWLGSSPTCSFDGSFGSNGFFRSDGAAPSSRLSAAANIRDGEHDSGCCCSMDAAFVFERSKETARGWCRDDLVVRARGHGADSSDHGTPRER